jgi:catechol 2,3-dioxygenase-like lactoylglutathione lyase family enzyme
MGVELNHLIIYARDGWESARFLSGILGLASSPEQWGPFVQIKTDNGVTLDFDTVETVTPSHYAFLLSEAEFDAAFKRLGKGKVTYYADPFLKHKGEINHAYGGRGCYFRDPSGHMMEIITKPYGPFPGG